MLVTLVVAKEDCFQKPFKYRVYNMNCDLRFVAHKLFVRYVNKMYGSFSRPWCSAATDVLVTLFKRLNVKSCH